MAHSRDALIATLGGTAVLALLGWMLWTFAEEPALESSEPPALPIPAAIPDGPGRVLPVAPPRDPSEDAPRAVRAEEQEPPEPMGPDGILGKVVDLDTGLPIQRFQVDVLPASDLEDGPAFWEQLERSPSHPFQRKLGIFFLDREPGTWDVVVQAPGYQPAVRRGLQTPAEDSAAHEFLLDRGPTILGRVLDETYRPVPAVNVFLHIVELVPGGSPPRQRITETDPEGRFSFSPLPAGEYAVSLLESRNTADRLGGIFVTDDTTHVELYLRPRHELTVTVQDDRGRRLMGASVELRSADHYSNGRSNEQGLVLLKHIPDGRHTLQATLEGYEPASEELEFLGGSTRDMRWLTLQPVAPP